MQIYTKWFLRLGLVIIAIPATSPLLAQSNDSRMLLEVQAMRQEIAELRDLVERQEYELSKLKRGLQTSTGSVPNAGQSSYGSNNNPVANNPVANNPTVGSLPSNNSSVYGTTGTTDVYVGNQSQATQVPSQNNTYQPNTVPSNGSQAGTGSYESGTVFPDGSIYRDGTVYRGSSGSYQGSSGSNQASTGSTYGPNTVNQSAAGSAAPSIVESIPGRSPTGSSVVRPVDPNVGSNSVVVGSQDIPNVDSSVNNSSGSFDNEPNSVPIEERVIGGSDDDLSDVQNSGVISVPRAPTTTLPSSSSSSLPNEVATAPIQAKFSEEDYYQQGFELLKEAEHDRAVQIFQEQIASYPQGELVDDAYYWIAESKYVNRDLTGSKQNFKTIIERYKQSPRLPDAMLKTAYIEQEQGNVIEARILLQEIVQFYPRSNAAISAKNRLGDLN